MNYTIENLLGIDLESNDDHEPYVEQTEPTTPSTEDTTYPIFWILGSVTIAAISVLTYRRKNNN